MSDFYLAVGADPSDPDSINLNSGDPYFILDGTLDLSTPGVVAFRQAVKGADADTRIAHANALFRMIERAARAESIGSAVTFSYRRGGSAWSHIDLKPAAAETLQQFDIRNGGAMAFYDLVLPCYETPRGDAIPITGDISGTHAGSTAAFLVTNVPGHLDALAHLEMTDTSASGVINRARVSVIRGDFEAATDYTAWVNAAAHGGVATDAVDANAFGGTVADRTLASTAWVDIARAVQPAGARQQGPMDGYARVKTSGTAIGTPGSLAATVNAPTATTATTSEYGIPTVGQVAFGSASGGTVSATLNDVTEGSLIIAVARSNDATSPATPTTPTNYSAITSVDVSSVTNSVQLYAFQRRNVAAGTHNVTVAGMSADNDQYLTLIEVINGDAVIGFGSSGSTSTTSEPVATTTMTDSSFVNEGILGIFGLATATLTDLTDFWYAGYEPATGGNTFVAALRIMDSPGQTPPVPKVRLLSSAFTWANVALNIKPKRTSSSVTTYQEPTPGELETGTYTARVRAIDNATYRGNATASTAASVTTARSSIGWSWTAVTNADSYELIIQYGSRFYRTITSGTSYELETLDGLAQASALPATTGAVAPPPYIRAFAGTLNDDSLSPCVPDEIPLSGSGAFEIVRLFSNQPLPPLAASIDDTWPDYAVEIQGKSANGANAPIQIDAIWIVPCREPQAEAWVHGLALGTKRRHIIESHRSGKGVIGWLEDTSTGDEAGRLKTAGSLRIPTNTCIVLLEFEQGSGVHTFGAQATAQLKLWPLQRWEAET